jgi:hypothetical protein
MGCCVSLVNAMTGRFCCENALQVSRLRIKILAALIKKIKQEKFLTVLNPDFARFSF